MLSILRLALCLSIFLCVNTYTLFSQCPNNVMLNPSFESGLSDWETDGNILVSTDAASGAQSLEIPGDGNRIYQTLSAQEGQSFSLNVMAKKLGDNGDANIGIKFLNGGYGLIDFSYATLDAQSDFSSIPEINFIAPAQTAFVEITAFTNAASSAIRVDDFCLEVQGTGNGPKPDLVISNMRGDFFINAGDPFDLTFDIGNIGQQIANGDLQVGVYISSDDQYDSNDQEMIVENYSNIPIGGTADLTAVFTTPTNLTSGNHYMIVVVDLLDQIIESNESNNQTSRILEVGGLGPAPCAIEISIIDGSIQCNDNNSPNNPDDDLWSFQMVVENTLNSNADGWTTEIAGQTYQGDYNEVQYISGLSIANGPLSFLVKDKADDDCEKEFLNLTPPLPCSDGTPPPDCNITVEIDQNSIVCNDNGTASDPNDDSWSFEFRVNNTSVLANGWQAILNGQIVEGNYGEKKSFSGLLIAEGTVDLFVEDLEDVFCSEFLPGIQPPAPCSNIVPPPGCNISIAIDQSSIICDDNGTSANPNDDLWSFSFTVDNDNVLLNGWKADVDGISFEGNYGDTKTVNNLLIADGAIDLLVTDLEDSSCEENLNNIAPPAACSNVTPPSNDEADLAFSNIAVDQILNIGETAHTQVEVLNIGLGDANGFFNMDYYISQDGFLSLDDVLLKAHTFGNFNAGTNLTVGISFPIPTSLVEGDYFLITFIDAQNDIDESNESNNVFVNEIRLEGGSVTPPSGLCEPYSLFPWEDYIGKVKINEEGFSSGKSEYSDFRNIVFDVPLQESNAIELTAFFSWENFEEYFSVYIDYNQDGDYTSDEIYYQGKIDAKANGTEKNKLFSGPFNINPQNAIVGLTTMRVIMSRDGYAGPCDVLNFGEVEDYSVNVVEELDYNPYLTKVGESPSALFVYPNPASEFVNVNLEGVFKSEGALLLIDQFGQVVLEKNLADISEDTYKLTLNEFPSGLYTIYVISEASRALHSKVLFMGVE